MDWVPGGIDRIFATYERIVSHQHPEHETNDREQPPITTPPVPVKSDDPPWHTPETAPVAPPTTAEEWYGPRPLTTKVERDAQRLKDTGGYDLGEHMVAGEQRLRAKEQQQQEDLKQLEQKQRDGFDPWNREDKAEEALQHRIENPNGASFQEDEAGLVNAYKDATSTGVYYDPATKTEYVKGSVTGRDFYDDFTKIPMWGNTRDSERYKQADAAYENFQNSGKPVDRIVGHSLGGSVALQMQKDHQIPKSRTFGGPVVDLKPFDRFYGDAERYRHVFDPVSILDRGAKWGKVKLYPHSYTGYDDM